MNKTLMYIFITVGGAIGAYLPVWLFHQDGLSFVSIIGGFFGGLAGIWAAVKFGSYIG